jgi:hypothetical protein
MDDQAFAVVVHNLFGSDSSSDDEWTPLPKRLPRIRRLTSETPVIHTPPTPARILPSAETNANGNYLVLIFLILLGGIPILTEV